MFNVLYFDNTGNIVVKSKLGDQDLQMELKHAAKQLEALGNVTRLEVYRLLIQMGPGGVPVGKVQETLEIPASTLSHHVAKLVQTGLITQNRESRTLYCRADYKNMSTLIHFLVDNCCCQACEPLEIVKPQTCCAK